MAKVRKKSGFLGKFIAALLGFIVGIVATIGGIGGAGYYIIACVPIKDGINSIGDMTGTEIDYTEFITESMASNSITGVIKEISTFAEEVSEGTASLGSLEKFSPLVRTSIDSLVSLVSTYGVPLTTDGLMSTTFAQLPDYLGEALHNTEIGKAALAYSEGGDGGIIQLVCYGEEGYEYIKTDVDGDGVEEIQMLGNNKPAILGDLKDNSRFNELLKRVSLAGFLDASGSSFDDDILLRSFFYGEENIDFVMVDKDGDGVEEVQMLPRTYVFAPTFNTFLETEDEILYTYDSTSETWTNTQMGYTISAATGDYAYQVIDADGIVVCDLKATAIPNVFEVYRSDIQQFRRGLTMGDLMEDGLDLEEILYRIDLGELLELNGNSDKLLLTIAYGEKGVDYTVDTETNEIIPITEPTKVGDLMDTQTLKEKIYDLKISDIMEISPLDKYQGRPEPDSMLLLLAYGEEGIHYELTDTDSNTLPDSIVWLTDTHGQPYSERTIRYLMEDGESVFESISVAAVLNVTTTSDALLKNLAYGASNRYTIEDDTFVMNYIVCNVVGGVAYDDMHDPFTTTNFIETVGTDDIYFVQNWKESYYIRGNGMGPYYAYETQEQAHEGLEEYRLKYRKQMLSNLRGTEAHLFIEEIELGAALGITPTSTDTLLVAIAFGYDGTHFDISGEEVVWRLNPATGLSYRPRTFHDLRSAENIIQSVRIADFIGDVDQSENPLMYTVKEKGWTVSDINKDNINSLKLKEVIAIPETDDGSVLYALRNDTIGDLETAIKDLTLRDVLGASVTENKFLKQLADIPLKDMKGALNDLTVVKVFEDDVYEEGTTNLTGAWKYLLTDADTTDGVTAVDEYTVNDFNEMMDNMATNIKDTAIKDLVADELMEFEGIDLTQSTIYGTPISALMPGKVTLGDLSLIDMLNVLQP